MPHFDKYLVTFDIPAKHTVIQLYPVTGFEPGGCADVFVVVKKFYVCLGRLQIGMTAGQGNVCHDGIRPGILQYDVRPASTYS